MEIKSSEWMQSDPKGMADMNRLRKMKRAVGRDKGSLE